MAEGTTTNTRIFRVTTHMSLRNQRFQTSFHLRDTVVPNQTAQNAHAAGEEWLNTVFRPAVSNSVKIERLEAEEVDTKDYYGEDYGNIFGLNGEPQTSTMLAVCVTLKSVKRARWANGRMFWPLIGQFGGDQINAALVPVYNTAMQAFTDKFVGSALFNDFKLVVVGSPLPPAAGQPPNPKRWIDVDTVKFNPIVTTVRSRKVGIGQ